MNKPGKVETLDMFPKLDALEQAKKDIMKKAEQKGASCPCCGQFVKVYRRTINSTMMRQLMTAYHKHGAGKYFHTRDALLIDSCGAGDFSKLEYWGLIEREKHTQGDDGKRSSGNWRITPLGAEFVQGKAEIPMYALVYNNKLLELKGEMIKAMHALGKKFDYNEIMGWTGASRIAV